MSPRTSARRLVRLVLRQWFNDVAKLTEPIDGSPTEDQQKAAYARLEREVRKAIGYKVQDLDRLHDAVREAVPEPHRAALSVAFNAYHTARVEQLVTTQQAAYILGIAVGQALSAAGARLAGVR